MRIIPATVQDASIIHEIMIKAFTKFKNATPPSSALDETVDSVCAALQNGEKAFICYMGDQPVGMVRFVMEDSYIYFFRLSVIPEKHGQGIAKTILRYLEDYAKQENKTELLCKVRIDVPENIRLYQSIGYHIYEETVIQRPGSAAVAVVSMEKPLDVRV